ncbi:alpha/beta fold hydrolase [Streptomyces sp. NPDC005388]|uniref:alpha/beta fold hydrolase n=1 Tax=Streptomyces sp. NPDC005388 TaxID=3156717 RepID=UPI0033B27D4F
MDRGKFAASFAADVPAAVAAFMADSQVPWGVDALGGTVSEPAWRTKPSWYLVATDDHMIPPPAHRVMSERAGSTVTEAPGSHAVYVSNLAAVAAVMNRAAHAASARWRRCRSPRRRPVRLAPFLRSGGTSFSAAGEQHRAHEVLARRPEDEERRTWHLAHAAVEPDQQIAELLEQLARRARGRGDVAGAVAAFTRAAALRACRMAS